jgi:hypothetical protein
MLRNWTGDTSFSRSGPICSSQRQAEFLQRQYAVEPRQLPDRVVAIAGLMIDLSWLQQPKLIVEPQLASGDLGNLGEFTDSKHERSSLYRFVFSLRRTPASP